MPQAASVDRGVAARIIERHLPLCRRPLFAFSLLAAEVIGLTIRFDSGRLEVGYLSGLVCYSRFLVQTLIATAAVMLLLGQRHKQPLLEQARSVGWLASRLAVRLRSPGRLSSLR